jgi:NAD(P)-dependent dehydrogenase (short-subunit alcohol dehydrogenase family)
MSTAQPSTKSFPGAPNFRLDGRVALITGAGRGIGLGMAKALASVGCAVAIQDIEPAVAEAEANKLRDAGAKAVAIGGDVLDLATPKRVVDETVAKLGGLHILVNNAAIQMRKHWLELAAEEIERQFRANLTAPVLFAQHAVPIMRQRRWGRIINLGSVQQRRGNPGMLAYSMSKAALVNFNSGLAVDLAKDGITVNLLGPGWFDTYRNRDNFGDDAHKAELGKKHVPLGRVGQPEDCGGIAVLLCSDAGEYITGQTIYVDGGISA